MTQAPVWNRAASALLDLLFPSHCISCHTEGSVLCVACQRELPRLVPPFCARCGQPQHQADCDHCQRWPLTIDGIRSALLMEGTAREAIHSLKYRNLRGLARPLAGVLYEYLSAEPLPGDVLLPVPLHPSRLRHRGYNQAALVARELSVLTGLPVVEDALLRRRNTPAQARTAGQAQRRENVRDAFVCANAALRGQSVLLVDDVCTTGATLDACARALKEAGVGVVWGLTVAREA